VIRAGFLMVSYIFQIFQNYKGLGFHEKAGLRSPDSAMAHRGGGSHGSCDLRGG